MEASVKDNGNGTYSCSYVPRKPVKHTAMVSWGGVSIPNSPFRVSWPSHLPRAPVPCLSIALRSNVNPRQLIHSKCIAW